MARILYITSGLGIGGAETMLVQLARELASRGHSQHVVSLSDHGDLAEPLRTAGAAVTELRLRSLVRGAIPALIRLRGLVAHFSPDIIQGWMYHGNVAAFLAHYLASRSRTRKLYWGVRASNMDSSRYSGIIKSSAWLSGCPDTIIANSRAGADFHIAQGFRADRVQVIANGIDTDRFKPDDNLRAKLRSELTIAPDRLVVIHVARVDAMKDHKTFLEAMAVLPQVWGLLVGAGTERLVLPANVRALGVRMDASCLYPIADVVASSSAFGEGFSNVVAEGMSAGLMPVATDVGDVGLIVGDTGFVLPPRDPAAFAAVLREILSLTPAERRRRGAAARSRIVSQFSLKRAADAFEILYLRR